MYEPKVYMLFDICYSLWNLRKTTRLVEDVLPNSYIPHTLHLAIRCSVAMRHAYSESAYVSVIHGPKMYMWKGPMS